MRTILLNKSLTKTADVSVIYSDKKIAVVLFNGRYASIEQIRMILNCDYEYISFAGSNGAKVKIIDASISDFETISGLSDEQYILKLAI